MPIFKRGRKAGTEDKNRPRHIAIIMDGNRRWAKKHGLPGKAGYSVGAETFRKIAYYCRDIGLDFLTVYAFSTENWRRPEDEVSVIMSLLEKYLNEAIEKMADEGIRFYVMGDIERLSPGLKRLVGKTAEIAKKIEGFQVNLCLNYGGRDEIMRAAKAYADDYSTGKAPELNEELFSGYFYSRDIPDPELVIRPGGEVRTSNFLLWQSAYSEFYFTDTLWPDFTTDEIDKAISEYSGRVRRFGK